MSFPQSGQGGFQTQPEVQHQQGPQTTHPQEVPAQGAPPVPGQQNITDTNNGFLVGVDPATPPQGGIVEEHPQGQPPVQIVEQQPTTQNVNPQTGRMFTEDEVARIRAEEKDKLYGRIEEISSELDTLRQEREARLAAEQEEQERIETERRKAEEAQLDARQLIELKEQEFNSRFEQMEQERERERAVFEMERKLKEVDDYKRDLISQNEELIMPELRDLIDGNTFEEVAQSVEAMKERTAAIMANMTAAEQQQRQSMRGVTPTGAPPVGPMEQAPSYEQLTPEEIQNMDMATYRANRDRLLSAASPNFRG